MSISKGCLQTVLRQREHLMFSTSASGVITDNESLRRLEVTRHCLCRDVTKDKEFVQFAIPYLLLRMEDSGPHIGVK